MNKVFFNSLKIDNVNTGPSDGLVMIEGYAAHFGKVNGNGEIVDEESFKSCLKMMKDGGQMPVFNYQHTPQIIGGWDEITTNTVGLYVKGHLNCNVADVRDNIFPLVQSGDVCHLSTEGWFDWDKCEERKNGLYIGEVFLYGISLVSLPADFEAKMNIKNSLNEYRKESKKRNRIFL